MHVGFGGGHWQQGEGAAWDWSPGESSGSRVGWKKVGGVHVTFIFEEEYCRANIQHKKD